jgi:hypothetical protein
MSAALGSTDGVLALPGAATRRRAADDEAATEACPTALWGRRDVVQVAVVSSVGVMLMAVAWYGSGDGRPLERQVPFLDLAVGGLLVAALGGGLFVLSGLRAVGARKAMVKSRAGLRAADRPAGDGRLAAGALVAGAAMTRYHRPDCRLATGKAVTAATRAEHERAARQPCGVCLR